MAFFSFCFYSFVCLPFRLLCILHNIVCCGQSQQKKTKQTELKKKKKKSKRKKAIRMHGMAWHGMKEKPIPKNQVRIDNCCRYNNVPEYGCWFVVVVYFISFSYCSASQIENRVDPFLTSTSMHMVKLAAF